MIHAAARACLVPLLIAVSAAFAAAAPRASLPPPTRAELFDHQRHSDINRLNMFVSNYGWTGHDRTSASPGLVYPRGSANTALYVAGLWIGGLVNGQPRMAVAEYASEFRPGRILPGGAPEPFYFGALQGYKTARFTGSPADTGLLNRTPDEMVADPALDHLLHHPWSAYLADAASRGAPTRAYRMAETGTPDPSDSVDVPGPDVAGDQMIWSVYNDADAEYHTSSAGGTAPIGVEVQQRTFAFDRQGPLGDAVFLAYRIIHKGTQTLENAYVAQWADPDIGGYTDDFAGCDTLLQLGYAYNATNSDAMYGSHPPALGYVLLRGPLAGGGQPRPIAAFQRYFSGIDPASALEAYRAMRGLQPDGAPVISPTDGFPTAFQVTGNPVTASGWIDHLATDKRILLSTGPFTLAPGDTQDVVFALVMGQGADRLGSILALKSNVIAVKGAFDDGFESPATHACQTVESCPGSTDFWSQYFAAGGAGAGLEAITAQVDTESVVFNWQGPEPVKEMAQALANESDARSAAKRRYAAFLANVSAWNLCLPFGQGGDRFLRGYAPIAWPALPGDDIFELLRPPLFPGPPSFVDAGYRNHVTINRQALLGVDLGGSFFNGGALLGVDFFGSPLDPLVQPDSFRTVEVRFSRATTQKAYRFLRLQQADGTAPSVGRGYLYGGFRDVPFTCWDLSTGAQLDVAFVERAVTDAAGALLPPGSQVVSFDSTWAPTEEPDGGREYLLVTSRPYAGVPRPELAVDGLPSEGTMPVLYALFSRLRTVDDVIDDGDAFEFVWGQLPDPGLGLDSKFLALEMQSLEDPAVVAAYDSLSIYLEAVNAGLGIGAVCGPPPSVDRPPDPEPAAGLALSLPWPNPARDALRVAFVLERSGPARLELLDVAGRRVLVRDVGSLGPGRHSTTLSLDGEVRAGVYFLRLSQGGKNATRRTVIVR